MINFYDYANENKAEHIPDHPYIHSRSSILIIGGSGSGGKKALLNLISNQLDLVKIYFYAKDPYEAKY